VAASALALAIRPNLVPAAGLVWLTAVVAMRGSRRERLRLAVALAVPMLAVAAAVAAINRHVWGEALMSGYGAPGEIFLAENVVPNLARLWQWTLETRAYWMIAAVPALLWLVATGARARWWPAAALTAGVVASYVSYAVFVEWWYLRFYLAAWPVLASAAAIAAWRLAVRWSAEAAGPVVLAVAAVVGASALVQTASRGVFDLWRVEHRYAAVAQWVRTATAPDAVVACVQHSGAIADGTGRTLLRWDAIDPAALDRLVERLADRRRSAWLVVDDWEEAPFRERFGRSSARGRLEWAPTAEARVGTSRVRIYDLTSPTRAQAPVLIPVIGGGPWPWRRDPAQPAHLPAR
jgi:hypothetical protein